VGVSRRPPVLQLHAVEMMRLAEGPRVTQAVRRALAPRPFLTADPSTERPKAAAVAFADLYRVWFVHVVRWLGTLGAPQADIEDLAQEVFLVVRRRLEHFDGRNAAGWLYRIASGQLRQHRRRSIFRAIFTGRDAIELEQIPHDRPSVVSEMETRQKQELLDRILSRMSEKRRAVFLLFEMQGYSGSEIAKILDVPLNTIKTRLYYARKDFVRLLAEHRSAGDSDR
jgi:RNA polymerase sigma-70 factor (ECF subfamily)